VLTGRVISWSTTDERVATVSSAGLVSGVANGGAYVVAVAEGVRDSAVVTVGHGPASWGTSTPVLVNASSAFASVTAGGNSSCALNATAQAWCWGTILTRLEVPTLAAGEMLLSSIVTAGHTCGLDSQGAAHCWGRNGSGQLGIASTTETSTPTAVVGGIKFKELTIGLLHTCGLTMDGSAYCWGSNFAGGLGDGTTIARLVPTLVSGGLSFVTITAGTFHTCALTATGEAYCWGGNNSGVLGLGDGSSTSEVALPGRVVTDIRFSSIRSGPGHVCALTTTGDAYCWGSNRWGQLGRTGREDGAAKVDTEASFADIRPGLTFTCGIETTGQAVCWGTGGFGELGNGLPIDPTAPSPITLRPTPVVGGHVFQSIAAGDRHVCALTVARALYCWGHKQNGAVGVP
jgi:alpha-tubulin suppressor-like RCC1 family protein